VRKTTPKALISQASSINYIEMKPMRKKIERFSEDWFREYFPVIAVASYSVALSAIIIAMLIGMILRG
jgi:hypothetical protein